MASPATAQRVSETDICTRGWQHLVGIVLGYPGAGSFAFTETDEVTALRNAPQRPVDDGWCRVSGADLAAGPELDQLEWRAEPPYFSEDPDALPQRLAVRVTGTQPGQWSADPYRLSAELTHVPSEGFLIIDRFDARLGNAETIKGSAVLGGAFFSTPRAAQMSLPGLHLDQLALTAAFSPDGPDWWPEEAGRDDIVTFVNGLSFAQMDRGSKASALDFARDMPDPRGALDVRLQSDRGLGWMQIIFALTQDEADLPGFLLDGAQLRVNWTPQ